MSPGKRLFDLLGATLGLLVLWPVLGVVAIMIYLDDGRPVFFRQERVGFQGKRFRIEKFRTMVVSPAAPSGDGPSLLTIGSRDPRITRAGYWLRRYKLDELPQLINVLAGEMSLVGPRPEVPHYVARYTADQRRVLELQPGITDPASLRYRHESEILAQAPDPERLYVEQIMPEKIRLNLEYADRASLWSDLAILVQTLFCLLR